MMECLIPEITVGQGAAVVPLYMAHAVVVVLTTHHTSHSSAPTSRPTAAPPPTVITIINTSTTKLSLELGTCMLATSE